MGMIIVGLEMSITSGNGIPKLYRSRPGEHAYSASKLAKVMFTYDLASRLLAKCTDLQTDAGQ